MLTANILFDILHSLDPAPSLTPFLHPSCSLSQQTQYFVQSNPQSSSKSITVFHVTTSTNLFKSNCINICLKRPKRGNKPICHGCVLEFLLEPTQVISRKSNLKGDAFKLRTAIHIPGSHAYINGNSSCVFILPFAHGLN